jgi:hypothetical protein
MKEGFKKTSDVNFFIMSIKDKKLRDYLKNVYLDHKDERLKEVERELFMEGNNIRNERLNKKTIRDSNRSWRKRNGK